MANFNIKLHRFTPGVFDQWGFELQHPEPTGTEDNLANTTLLPRNNILAIQVKYIATQDKYGANLMGTNFYYVNLFGAGVLDIAGFNTNTGTYRIGNTNGDFYFRVNAQVGGEVNRTADLIRVSTLNSSRIFTGVQVSAALFDEMIRRMGGTYPDPIQPPE